MASAAQQLADEIADASLRRQRGEPVAAPVENAARLVVELGVEPGGVEEFFVALAAALRARRTKLPPIEELPACVGPLLVAAGAAFEVGPDGEIDYEATAQQLNEVLERMVGTSPRRIREERLHREIRETISASVADSLRRHGLTPACDMPDVPDDDESET
jgi:hypothetical protein